MKAVLSTTFALRSLALTVIAVGFVACQPNSGSQAPGASPATSSAPAVEGGSSGGGGYVSENSALLLEQSSQKLASMIRKSTPAIYGDLPQGWSAERLASIIEKVRSSPDKDLRRDDKDLMFNYAVDADGTEYIEALKPFFHTYGAVPVKMQTAEQLRDLQNDLMLKLLHETAHHLKLDEKAAEAFAYDKMLEMDLDIYSCVSNETVENGRPMLGFSFNFATGLMWRIEGPPGARMNYTIPSSSTGQFQKNKFTIGSFQRDLPMWIRNHAVTFNVAKNTISTSKSFIGELQGSPTNGLSDAKVEIVRRDQPNTKDLFIVKGKIHRTATDQFPALDAVPTMSCEWRSDVILKTVFEVE